MIASVPAKILVGISLDAEESKELLNWAITVLAQPNDTVVALHVLAAEATKKHVDRRKEENKRRQSITKYQTQIRQAKAFAISIMGEFVETCQSKQVNLEARVDFSSCVGRGLTKEAKGLPADFLVIGGKRNQSKKVSCRIKRYCCEHVPEGCSLVLLGKNRRLQQDFHSNSKRSEECHDSSSMLSEKDSQKSNAVSSDDEHLFSQAKREMLSPRTVLDAGEGESQGTEEDTSSFEESSILKSPVASEFRGQSEYRKPMSPFKRISSFLFSSFGLNARKRNDAFFSKENQQPLLKCFSNVEIANATNNFHSEKDSQKINAVSSDDEHLFSQAKREMLSPRTVLDASEGESQGTEEDTSSFKESSILKSPVASEFRGQSEYRKPMSPFKRISSFFFSSFDLNARKRNDAFFSKENQQPLLKCFSYVEIANATNNFHSENMVGQGGYSVVYRGNLDDGRSIAVKRLVKDNSKADKEKEFLLELGIIVHVNHPNTASLLGCCLENGLYLIFKFYPNGTLSSALHGKPCKSLEWPVRFRIALGVARGLHYLHKCCKHRIIHRDIKASNVLLGPDFEPQISDFGLAKWLPNKWTHHAVIPIEGTFGYLAPEYFMHGIVDEKTDVFAFGILLLEIVTGRMPVDSSKQNLLLWAKPLMESGKLTELADPKLEGKYDMNQLHRMVLTAAYCVRQSSTLRPSMTEVLELLTCGHDSEPAPSWKIPKFTSEETDDYSLVFGYEVPSDIALDDL